jgi:hypothetical protein
MPEYFSTGWSPPQSPQCDSCGVATQFSTRVSGLGETPALLLFECQGCGAVKWLTEQPPRPSPGGDKQP